MHVHGNSSANPSINALLAQARQPKAQLALGNSAIESKPGLGLGRGVGEAKKAEGSPTPEAAQAPTVDTLEGIRKHWGQSDSPFDVNGDGTVNIDDILHFIASQGQPGKPDGSAVDDATASITAAEESEASTPASDATIPDELSTTDPKAGQPLSLDGFNQHWGQANDEYDLNSDGTVNMDDMLAFINQQPSIETPELAPPTFDRRANELPTITGPVEGESPSEIVAGDGPAAIVGNQESTDQPQVTIDGLLGAWGTNNSTFDLNGDGTVNMDDVLQHIAQLGAPQNAGSESPRAASAVSAQLTATDIGGKSQRGEQAHVRVQNLVNSLINRLNETGFENQPPTNIRDIVSRLDLHPSQMNFVMNRLGERYPQGLGVNLRA